MRGEKRYNNIYSCDIHYFDNIDNEHKAYWIGYILADGHISKAGCLMFGCASKDIDLIHKIKQDLNSNHPIKYDNYNNPTLNIGSIYLCERLFEMGFTNNKSYEFNFEKVLNNIPKCFINHFVRGMFDGDGSIRYYNYPYTKGYQYHFGYTGLKNVCEFVTKYLNINTKLINEGNDLTYTCATKNAPLIKYIYSVLYEKSTIYCNRKYSTFQEVLKLIHEEKKDIVHGVTWYKQTNKWMAACHINKIYKTIGYYEKKEDAEFARLKYEYDNFGSNAPQWYFFKKYNIGGY